MNNQEASRGSFIIITVIIWEMNEASSCNNIWEVQSCFVSCSIVIKLQFYIVNDVLLLHAVLTQIELRMFLQIIFFRGTK